MKSRGRDGRQAVFLRHHYDVGTESHKTKKNPFRDWDPSSRSDVANHLQLTFPSDGKELAPRQP